MIMNKCIPVFLLLMTATAFTLAQEKERNPIAYKTIEKTIPVATNDVFNIVGEKTTLTVKAWNKNHISLKITFSAEHTDHEIAKKELEYMHYSLSRDKHTVELRNAFILPPKTDGVQSKVRVIMELNVPAALKLSIYNRYGNAELSGLSGTISAVFEFSDLVLNNVTGEINIRSSYSEVRGEGLALLSFTSDDEESKYTLALDRGSYSFNSRHSDHDLTLGDIQAMTINAKHTDITIQPKEFRSFNYQLISKEGNIYLPIRFGDLVKKEKNQSRLTLSQKPAMPLIDITTTFNTITIQ
jgi:hypothetical protein